MARNDNNPWKKQGLTEAQYWKKKYLEQLEANVKYVEALEEVATSIPGGGNYYTKLAERVLK